MIGTEGETNKRKEEEREVFYYPLSLMGKKIMLVKEHF